MISATQPTVALRGQPALRNARHTSLPSRLRHHGARLAVAGGTLTTLLVLLALFGPTLAPYSPTDVSLVARLKPPSLDATGGFPHVLGSDQLGRDVLSRILHAAQVTVTISLVAMALSAAAGVALGLLTGYFGGVLDMLLMRVADIQLAFPTILLAITIVAVLGSGIPVLIMVFVVSGWVHYVRIIRAQAMVAKEMQYVEAARALGAGHGRIVWRHLVPNLLTEIIILMNLEIGRVILMESSLSYLGLGVQPPLPTWGNMLNEGRLYLQTAWWVVAFPGAAIMLTVLGLNLLAEGLRRVYDPKART
jgi:peptide/nickel transport system permease protein